jgi:hypothetical protein
MVAQEGLEPSLDGLSDRCLCRIGLPRQVVGCRGVEPLSLSEGAGLQPGGEPPRPNTPVVARLGVEPRSHGPEPCASANCATELLVPPLGFEPRLTGFWGRILCRWDRAAWRRAEELNP